MSVKGAVNEATESRVVQHVARAGYPISGVLHLLIAYTIVRIALGFCGEDHAVGRPPLVRTCSAGRGSGSGMSG
jgi:hypothetical protein